MIINSIIAGAAQASGLPYYVGKTSNLSNSQTITFTHNLGTENVLIYFWADSGTVSANASYPRVCFGICGLGISKILSGYYQLQSDGTTHASPNDKPLIVAAGFATNATSPTTYYATGNATTYNSDPTSSTLEIKNTSTRFNGVFNFVAVDISGKINPPTP